MKRNLEYRGRLAFWVNIMKLVVFGLQSIHSVHVLKQLTCLMRMLRMMSRSPPFGAVVIPVYHPSITVYHPFIMVYHPSIPVYHPFIPVYHPSIPVYAPKQLVCSTRMPPSRPVTAASQQVAILGNPEFSKEEGVTDQKGPAFPRVL